MSEVKLFEKVKKIFQHSDSAYHLQRHEDVYSSGIPDVSYGIRNINGWIELKYDAAFPVAYKTKLRKEQKPWLIARGLAAGNCYVLHQLGDLYMLIPYQNILEIDGKNQEDAFSLCEHVFYGKLDSLLVDFITIEQSKPQQVLGLNHF